MFALCPKSITHVSPKLPRRPGSCQVFGSNGIWETTRHNRQLVADLLRTCYGEVASLLRTCCGETWCNGLWLLLSATVCYLYVR